MRFYSYFFGIFLLSLASCNSKSQETKLFVLFPLDKAHKEISGLVYQDSNHLLWMLEDQGNKAALYAYNLEEEFLHTVTVKDQINIDWEDLSKDSEGNLYIGDFGNNDNNRKDLRILKIDHSSLKGKEAEAIQITNFSYEDQQDFPPKKGNLVYDVRLL